MNTIRSPTWTLTGADGRPYQSDVPGVLGGHRGGKRYGRLGCRASLQAIARGGRLSLATVLTLSSCAPVSAQSPPSAQSLPQALYEVTTETGMPNLEENLRYAARTDRRCLDPQDLSTVFWMLRHESLQDCRLQKAAQRDATASYLLVCTGGHGTMGDAQWRFDPESLRGTMTVKLGGKNMTFYQRVVAKPVGRCPGN